MTRTVFTIALVATLAAACGNVSEPAPLGLGEPLRLRFTPPRSSTAVAGQFFPGPLPAAAEGPTIASIDNRQSAVYAGELGKRMAGNTSGTASGVGFKFENLGTGFWVAPVSIPDNQLPGTLLFEVALDFGWNVPDGKQILDLAAVDASGKWGPASQTPLYFQAGQPSGAAVASLTWDSSADLDIQILGPDGLLDAKHPTAGGFVDGGIAPGHGVLDRDSNASCVPDGQRREDVVWTDEPTPGLYLAKVDLFSSCGEAASNFLFQLYVHGELRLSLPGRLLSIDADNGRGPGLAITNFSFPQ